MSTVTAASRRKSKNKLLSAGKTWFIAAITVAVLAAVALFVVLSQVTATTTYYVLNQDVPARSQITADMLAEVSTSEGGEPRNAIDIFDVQNEAVFAQYALSVGDIVTASNTGALQKINEGIPEDYVVASFTAPAEFSVAGKLSRGDYIDIISGTSDMGGSALPPTYALRHVLLLDVAADLAASAAAPATSDAGAAEANAVRQGIPTLYTVALPAADALKLAAIADNIGLVVLSPANFTATEGIVTEGIVPGVAGDSGEGTDPTFGQAEEGVEEPVGAETPAPTSTDVPATEAPTTEAPATEETTPEGDGS